MTRSEFVTLSAMIFIGALVGCSSNSSPSTVDAPAVATTLPNGDSQTSTEARAQTPTLSTGHDTATVRAAATPAICIAGQPNCGVPTPKPTAKPTPTPTVAPTPAPTVPPSLSQSQDLSQVDAFGNASPTGSLGTLTLVQGVVGNFSVQCVLVSGYDCPNVTLTWSTDTTTFQTTFNPSQTVGSNATSLSVKAPLTLAPGNYAFDVKYIGIVNNLQFAASRPLAVTVQSAAGITATQRSKIANLAASWKAANQSDRNFGAVCLDACVVTVEHLVNSAIGKYLGNSQINNSDILKKSGAIAQISQNSSTPGDLLIVDSQNHADAHTGICEDNGCTDAISNSSSHCTFSFDSAHNARFSYPGSPYVNGTATYWRIQ